MGMETLLNGVREHGAIELFHLLDKVVSEEAKKYNQALTMLRTSRLAPVIETKEDFWKLSKQERRLWQASKEAERRKVNAEQGIDGRKLLTKENVERWRAEGMTYAAIARDIVGCSEYEISAKFVPASTLPPWSRRNQK